MAYATVTLTGKYLDPAGNPATGQVIVVPTVAQVLDPAGDVILAGRVVLPLAAGAFTVTLPATDDAALNPTGFQYRIVPQLDGAHLPAFTVSLPAAPAAVDLADLTPDPVTLDPVTHHESDTTDVHGIADTSLLETQAGAQARVDAHADQLHRDTGWRVLSSWGTDGVVTGDPLPAGMAPTADTAGAVMARRLGHVVSWRFTGVTWSAQALYPSPVGFRTSTLYRWVVAVFNGVVRTAIPGASGTYLGVAGAVASPTYGTYYEYETAEPWPTSLPGTPA